MGILAQSGGRESQISGENARSIHEWDRVKQGHDELEGIPSRNENEQLSDNWMILADRQRVRVVVRDQDDCCGVDELTDKS